MGRSASARSTARVGHDSAKKSCIGVFYWIAQNVIVRKTAPPVYLTVMNAMKMKGGGFSVSCNKKSTLILCALLALFFLFPALGIPVVSASTVAEQLIATDLSSDRNGAPITQTIGNGYTHIPTTLTVKIKKSSGSSTTLYGSISCWNDVGYTGACSDQSGWNSGFSLQSSNTIATTSTDSLTLVFTFSSSALRGSKYYTIGVGTLSGNSANDAYGSAAGVYAAGSAANASPLADIYFILEGDIPAGVVIPPVAGVIIAEQGVASDRATGTSGSEPTKRQTIGSGHTQTPLRLLFRVEKDNENSTSWIANMTCWNEARYATLCSDQQAWTDGWLLSGANTETRTGFGEKLLSFTFASTSALRSEKYYKIQLNKSAGDSAWNVKGSAMDAYSSGDADGTASPLADLYFRLEGTAPAPTPVKPDPVIVIPGILGSSDKNGAWVIDPIFHTYDDLIATLAANGYAEGKDLFTFPYDWRKSNVLTALELRDRIDEVQDICACEKVDLVAHSMGGLVARQYIQSDKYENDVDQLIFLGTPHLGSVDTYLAWEGGEVGTKTGRFFQKIKDRFSKVIFLKEAQKAGFLSIFDYVRSRPVLSVNELLPIYDYLYDKTRGDLMAYPSGYPQNAFLENLRNGTGDLVAKVKITNIVGDLGDESTLNLIKIIGSPNPPLWEHGYPEGFDSLTPETAFEFGFGDGTVPLNSTNYIQQGLATTTFAHNFLPTGTEGIILKKLTGKDASVTFDTNSIFKADYKLLLIKLLSPIDVLVTAPDGKRIGKNFQTGNEFNEIDGAFYSGFLTDDEYVTIPNPLDGEYKIEIQGTGTGEYTVATAYISDTVSAEKDFTAHTLPGLESELHLSVNNADPQTLDIAPMDTTPPEIEISSPQAKDYLRSEMLPIAVSIQDTESGVLSSTIAFDDRTPANRSAVDLFFEKLGNHSVNVSATDLLGNATSGSVSFRVVATLESAIADIERAYSLGWIAKKSVKDTLIKKLQSAIKLEKKIDILEEKLSGKPAILKRIEKIEKHIDKLLAKAFLKELEREHPKNINGQAFRLLEEDVRWLLDN